MPNTNKNANRLQLQPTHSLWIVAIFFMLMTGCSDSQMAGSSEIGDGKGSSKKVDGKSLTEGGDFEGAEQEGPELAWGDKESEGDIDSGGDSKSGDDKDIDQDSGEIENELEELDMDDKEVTKKKCTIKTGQVECKHAIEGNEKFCTINKGFLTIGFNFRLVQTKSGSCVEDASWNSQTIGISAWGSCHGVWEFDYCGQ